MNYKKELDLYKHTLLLNEKIMNLYQKIVVTDVLEAQ